MTALMEAETEARWMDDPDYAEAILDALSGRGPHPGPYKPPPEIGGQNSGLISLVAGPFASDVARLWSGGRIAEYLMAPDTRRHVWHCCLASERVEIKSEAVNNPDAMFIWLTRAKSSAIIVNAYGACPAGLVAALGKCGPKAQQVDFYRALVKVLGRDDLGAKFVRHREGLSEALVLGISAVPTRLQSKQLFHVLQTGAIDEAEIAHFAWTVARLEALGVADVAQAIRHEHKPVDAVKKAFHALPFPPPPWPGNDRLRPIESSDDLRRVGMALKNCLRDSDRLASVTSEVLRGLSYFYEWRGQEPGLLRFRKLAPLGWVLGDGNGENNKPLSCQTWADIELDLAAYPACAPVWVDSDGDGVGARFLDNHVF